MPRVFFAQKALPFLRLDLGSGTYTPRKSAQEQCYSAEWVLNGWLKSRSWIGVIPVYFGLVLATHCLRNSIVVILEMSFRVSRADGWLQLWFGMGVLL
mmetsp:Transcript_45211/g.119302  ORF Transcript_45211/g.119302 Transcript_45211/m.119302 type:complete len:98 (+) Transcript_45211:145-438(+)